MVEGGTKDSAPLHSSLQAEPGDESQRAELPVQCICVGMCSKVPLNQNRDVRTSFVWMISWRVPEQD